MPPHTPDEGNRAFNRSMLFKLVVVAFLMFGFGFALVPMYRAICAITGINNLVQRDATAREAKNTQVDTTRTISIELDANARGPLSFKPERNSIDVHPGEVMTVMYQVSNGQPRAVQAQAIPSYAPKQATEYFKKIECFCFTQQTLAANETKLLPVVFVSRSISWSRKPSRLPTGSEPSSAIAARNAVRISLSPVNAYRRERLFGA